MKLRIDVEDVWKGDSCGLWPEEERKRWVLALVFGTVALYAVRTVVPLCAVPMAQDLFWDKQVSVCGATIKALLEFKNCTVLLNILARKQLRHTVPFWLYTFHVFCV